VVVFVFVMAVVLSFGGSRNVNENSAETAVTDTAKIIAPTNICCLCIAAAPRGWDRNVCWCVGWRGVEAAFHHQQQADRIIMEVYY